MSARAEHITRIENGILLLQSSVAEADAWAARFEREVRQREDRELGEIALRREREHAAAKAEHGRVLGELDTSLEAAMAAGALQTAPWSDPRWLPYTPSTEPPTALHLGSFALDGPFSSRRIPALLPFIGGRSLIIRASGDGKQLAIGAIQSLTLRLFMLIPPGKLRVLFIDPVGMSNNVAAFMTLKDYRPDLVSEGTLFEKPDIERRLVELTTHMARVNETYLRNQYQTLEEYNRFAGEVAEAYRVVVALNFPEGFSDEAARRLVSIVTNGPRCGVLALVLVDPAKPQPYGFDLADLERDAHVVTYDKKFFRWSDPVLGKAKLELTTPPPIPQLIRMVEEMGRTAQSSTGARIMPDRILPQRESWWTGDTSEQGFRVPIGRAGARALQYLQLGRRVGTAHNALIGGQIGSGKSTLIHTLILSLALEYSPDEIGLYLIDLKGVSFKDYATHRLPHVRVVAVASEREFAVSVLRSLREERLRRERLIRSVGEIQDLAGYRRLPEEHQARRKHGRLPRLLLIVDEFQQLFIEDDSIAAEAETLLEETIRLGRGFGIHVLLASQSLAGTAGRIRPLLGQVTVRIALRCVAEDSELILGRGNTMAKNLESPPKAYYTENSEQPLMSPPFQTVALDDDTRIHYLRQISEFAQQHAVQPRPFTLFEGNVPPTLGGREDHPIHALLASAAWPAPGRSALAWIGEPVSVEAPTAACFARSSGRNLLMIGADEDAVAAMATTSLLSLAAQHHPDHARFYVADLTTAAWESQSVIAPLLESLPHHTELVEPADLARVLDDLVLQITGQQAAGKHASPWSSYLVLLGLQRLRRSLRRDEAGYSPRRETPPSGPGDQFAAILRDGPETGVHVLAWADDFAAVSQLLDTRTLNEFGMRVALQVSERDSSQLLGSPAANRLAVERALLLDKDQPTKLEKFRPYRMPEEDWLHSVCVALRGRR